ncbi:MAG: hypothetical protein Q4P32_09810 [Micrococcales bacterium]|nr:hypothetical protein [Micrococcales bacterium]
MGRRARWAGAVAPILAALLGIWLAVRHIGRTGYGLDRTDEGQYLLLMADPRSDPATVFGFGYVLHPLYALLGGDVEALRNAGFAVTALAAGVLLVSAARRCGLGWPTALSAGVASGGVSAIGFAWFPMTPSYNTVALWGSLLVATGLVQVRPSHSRSDAPAGQSRPGGRSRPGGSWAARGGWALTGAGVAVTGIGKPTSAAMTFVIVLAALLVMSAADPGPAWRERARNALAVAAGAVVVVASFVLVAHRGVGDLIGVVTAGVRGVELLQGHERLLRWDPLDLGAVTEAIGSAAGSREPDPAALQALLWLPLATLIALGTRAALAARASRDTVARISKGDPATKPPRGSRRDEFAVVTGLLLLPACYAFGTNGNLWSAAGRGAPLWVAALAIAVTGWGAARKGGSRDAERNHQARFGLALLLATALAAGVTSAASDYYYRYPSPGSGANTPVQAVIDERGNRLELTPADAASTATLLPEGRSLTGSDILDTTGASPGYVYQLGGRALGSSWLLGGYRGSGDAARHALSLEPCARIEGAIVLYAPASPRRIDTIWSDLRVDPVRDYRRLFTFRHLLGFDVQVLAPTEAGRMRLRCRAG